MLTAVGSMAGIAALPGMAEASDHPMPILDFIKNTTPRIRTAIPGSENELTDNTIQLNVCTILCHANSHARSHYDLDVNYLPGWEEWAWGGVLGLSQMQVARLRGAKSYWRKHPDPDTPFEEYIGYKEDSRGFWTADDPLLMAGLDGWNNFWKTINEATSLRCREGSAERIRQCVQSRKATILMAT
jgi:hypothetical protein